MSEETLPQIPAKHIAVLANMVQYNDNFSCSIECEDLLFKKVGFVGIEEDGSMWLEKIPHTTRISSDDVLFTDEIKQIVATLMSSAEQLYISYQQEQENQKQLSEQEAEVNGAATTAPVEEEPS